MNALKIIGTVTAAAVVVGLLWNYGDVRRYLKIEMM
jgi:hypothetical protein